MNGPEIRINFELLFTMQKKREKFRCCDLSRKHLLQIEYCRHPYDFTMKLSYDLKTNVLSSSSANRQQFNIVCSTASVIFHWTRSQNKNKKNFIRMCQLTHILFIYKTTDNFQMYTLHFLFCFLCTFWLSFFYLFFDCFSLAF